MIVFLNGKFVPEERAVVSVFDRGFLFGDAVWEALLVTKGRLFCWGEHMHRLQHGLDTLKIALPFSLGELRAFASQLIERNKMPEGILRVTISRGITERGYSPRGARNPAVVMTMHPAAVIASGPPVRWRVITSSVRLPVGDSLSLFKSANKLPQVLARAEADDAQVNDAILLNTSGEIVEGTSSNVFWVKNKVVNTPALPAGPLPGVTRGVILELCRDLKIATRETVARPGALLQADGVFLTMTSFGVVEVEALDGNRLKRSPTTKRLHQAYRKLLREA